MWRPRGMVQPNTHQQRDQPADAVMSSPHAPLGYYHNSEGPGFAASDRQPHRYGEYGSEAYYRQVKRRRASSEGYFHKTYAPARRQEIPRRSSDPTSFVQAHGRTTNKRLLEPPYRPEEQSTFDRINIFEALSRRQHAQENLAADNSMEPIPYKSCDDRPPKRKAIPKKSSSASIVTMDEEVSLGKDFKPGSWDVVCGRGKNWSEHVSNRRFRILVALYLREYFETISRTSKSKVIDTIVNTVQETGSFVKKVTLPKKKGDLPGENYCWYKISNKDCREKVSHALRDCLIDPQSTQLQWSMEERQEKLKEAQNSVFRSLELMF